MDTSIFHAGSGHWVPTSFSASSLDVGQLTGANYLQSLISESVTLDSLSSKSSDVLPAFPTCKLPRFATIALGEHLKMFSAVLSQPEEKPRFHVKSTIMLAAPTSPRLKSMFKECLSIKKWAENSTNWQAPGHIPWESIEEENSTKWTPEGSLFSPESFSRALSEARTWRGSIVLQPATPSIFNLSIDRTETKGVSASRSPSDDSMNTDLVGMMRELKSIKSFFEEIQGDSDSNVCLSSVAIDTSSLPSLVVSNSHFTFPLTLESCQSISQYNATTLAHRRGKKVPPRLKLGNENKPPELSYPEIPTAFLGSPSHHIPQFEFAGNSDKPALRVEDMINNLRLQCSTMALNTPPMDASWNSRSVLEPTVASAERTDKMEGKAEADEWDFANYLLEDYKDTLSPVTQSQANKENLPKNRHSAPSSVHNEAQRKTRMHTSIPSVRTRKMDILKAVSNSKTDDIPVVDQNESKANDITSNEALGRCIPSPVPLRSAMVKDIDSHPRKPCKSVRFALTQSEVEKDVTSTTPIGSVAKGLSQGSKVSMQDDDLAPQTYLLRKSSIGSNKLTSKLRPASAAPAKIKPKDIPPAKVSKRPPPAQVKGRAHSVIVASPLRHSMLPKASESENIKLVFNPPPTGHHRSATLGRHSLSRIIKAPLFAGRDSNKRATISIGNKELNENAGRRESEVPSMKKSRMPVPLRKILTRFK